MTLEELVVKNRSCRAFDERRPIPRETMLSLIDLARRTASGCNFQPLRYRVLSESDELEAMMKNCRFAASLGLKLPPEHGLPTGFILIFIDGTVGSPESLALKDVGIAAQTILLGATELGFAGCMLGSFNAERLTADFDIPDRYRPVLAIALGAPGEDCRLTEAENGDVKYYRADGVHYVPKRRLPDILI